MVVCSGVVISRLCCNNIAGEDLRWRSDFTATTLLKLSHAACPRDREGNSGRCDGIDERRLPVVWWKKVNFKRLDLTIFHLRNLGCRWRGHNLCDQEMHGCTKFRHVHYDPIKTKVCWPNASAWLTVSKNFLYRILGRRTIPSPVPKLPLTLVDWNVHTRQNSWN